VRVDYLKPQEKNAVAKITTQSGTTARGKSGYVAVLPEAIGDNTQIDVGDAKKVFERYFRKRAIAASTAGRNEPAVGTPHSAIYSLLRK
jgi:hypothetical protein